MQSVIDKIKALPNAAKPDGMWSTLRRRKEKQYGKTQWKKNPIKLIPKPADALAFKQLPIPLRDKLVNTAPIKSFDPHDLVTNQPMVSQADLVHFADHGTDPEPVIILKSTDGLYVHNGNHRSALAMMQGRRVKARYIDLSQVPQLKGKKPIPQERAVDAYKMRDAGGAFTSEEELDKVAKRASQLVHTASLAPGMGLGATGSSLGQRAALLASSMVDFTGLVDEVFAAQGHPFEGKRDDDGHGVGNCEECGKPWKDKAHWRIAAGGPGSGWTTENGHVSNLTPQDKGQKLQKMGFFHTDQSVYGGNKEVWQHKDTGTQVHVSKYNAPNQPNLRKFEVYKSNGDKIFNGHQFSKAVEKMQNTPMQKSEMKPDTGPKTSLPSGVKQYDPTVKPSALDQLSVPKGGVKTTEPSIPAAGKNAVLQDAGFHVAYTSKLVETGQPTDVWVHPTTQDAVHVIATDPTHSSWKYIPANGSPSTGKMADDLKQAIATGGKPAAADKPSSTKTSTPSEPKTPDMIPVTKEWWDKLDKVASDNWVKGGSSKMTVFPDPENKPNDYDEDGTGGWYGKVAAAMGVPFSSVKDAADRINTLQDGKTAEAGNEIGSWSQSVVNNVGQAGNVHAGTAIEYAHAQQWIKENGMPNGGTLTRGYTGTGAMGTAPGFVKSPDQITLLRALAIHQPEGFETRLPVNGVEGFSCEAGWEKFTNNKGVVVQLHDVSPKNVISGWGTGGMLNNYADEKEWLLAFKNSVMPIRTFAEGKNAAVKIKSAAVTSATDKIFWDTLVQLKKSGWNWTVKGKKITITPPGWFTDRKNIVLDPDQMAAASVSSSSEEAAVDNLSPGTIAREMIRSKALGVSSAAYKLAGVTSFQGLPISIENKKGDVRSGVDADGTKWSVVMPESYGYIKGTKGADGSPIDCFVGPLKDAKFAYICHINKTDGSGFDEDKTFIGFASATRAKAALLAAYSGVDVFHSMTILPMHEFIKRVLSTKNSKRPHKIHAEVAA